MSYYVKTVCSRCGRPLQGKFYDACPACQKDGVNANYKTVYDLKDAKLPPKDNGQPGIFRFREFFALGDNDPVVSLGEGNTPFRRLERMGEKLGMPNLYIKDESKNPTMSHKDRLCSIVASQALAWKVPGLTIASTGNQGASIAAYASACGLPCVVFTTPNVSMAMKCLMQAYGAYVFVTPTLPDRLIIMDKLVRQYGFMPACGVMKPPIGSSCYGFDGYKTIAFELYEQMGGDIPDWMVVPISYGGMLYGIFKGFCDLKEMGYIEKIPRLAACEVLGPLEKTIEAGSNDPIAQPARPSILTSMATGMVAYHAVHAVMDSNGVSRCSGDEEAKQMQKTLAQTEGIFGETATATPFVVIEKLLAEGVMKPDEKVVAIITSTGLKDLETVETWLPEIPCINPTVEELRDGLWKSYNIKL